MSPGTRATVNLWLALLAVVVLLDVLVLDAVGLLDVTAGEEVLEVLPQAEANNAAPIRTAVPRTLRGMTFMGSP